MAGQKRLTIDYVRVDALVPYAGNARLHSAEQVDQIAASIRRFGFNNPVLIDARGTIVAGHGRVLAAKLLGLDDLPIVRLGHLTDEERRAYTLADNRIALNATWDADLLAREVAAIEEEGLVALAGFSDKEIERLLADAAGPGGGNTGADAAPPVPKNSVSRPGDLWLLGTHRLLCGDATSVADVHRLLDGTIPPLMVTDPPYGVNYDPNWRNEAARTSEGIGNRIGAGAVGKVHRADWREAWALFPGAVAYVWCASLHGAEVQASLEAAEFKLRAQIVWVKTRPVISRGHYHWQHEPALYVARGDDDNWRGAPRERFDEDHEVAAYVVADGETANWHGNRKQSTVWTIEHVKSETGHGTQKPIECMRRPIVNNSDVGEHVYDPFSGSGTTLIACEITHRRGLGMEIDPAYVDVIVRRWQDFAGCVARLDGGRAFNEVAAERGVPLAA